MSDNFYKPTTQANNTLTQPVRRHLVNVYLTLAAMCAIATMSSQWGGRFGPNGSSIGSIGAVASGTMIRYTSFNSASRWALLFTYSLFSGVAISALVSHILHWDHSGMLIFRALSSSVLVFLIFSFSATMSNRRNIMYIGALASSALGLLIWLSLANVLFIQSSNLFSFELYAGLLAFAGFVMYDTQMIIERASSGIMDIPGHAIELFMDLYALFIRLASIIMKREMDREDDRRRRRSERSNRG
ncbi:inhibitor of apoptosis-promoting Bax1-domain-containing protein [Sporodiniella umbellata]|nr:inhibitor of apoptosis-promoting Bax1-domain-containing protein [Sporodiniella umbellata]